MMNWVKKLNSYKNLDYLSFTASTLKLLEDFEEWEKEFNKISDDKYTYNEKCKDYLYWILESRNYYNELEDDDE